MRYSGSKFQEKSDPAKLQEITSSVGENIS